MNNPEIINSTQANREAIYNVYSYLANKSLKSDKIADGDSFQRIVEKLENSYNDKNRSVKWDADEKRQLDVLKAAIKGNPDLAKSTIGNQINIKDGLSACTFIDENGNVSVVYRGTGNGEWLDNGQALSGIPQKNTYKTATGEVVVENDYASTQQVDALNWFNEIVEKNNWTEETNITVSGHSKGGNKAQFVTINSDLVDNCYSFDGQGFSPEAIESFSKKLGDEFEQRCNKIISISAENDYVNVLGTRLAPKENIYFVSSPLAEDNIVGNHFADALLNDDGIFSSFCEQGEISEYIESLSENLMNVPPVLREYGTNGVMSIFQRFKGDALYGAEVPLSDTVVGIYLAGFLMKASYKINAKDEIAAIIDLISTYSDDLSEVVESGIEHIGVNYDGVRKFGEIFSTSAIFAFVMPFVNIRSGGKKMVEYIDITFNKLKSKLMDIDIVMYQKVASFINTASTIISNCIINPIQHVNGYTSSSPYITVNTESMLKYADRLQKAINRLAKLQTKIAVLNQKTNSTELTRIIRTDSVIKYNWYLLQNKKYLVETANDFYYVEREIYNKF